MSVQHQGLPVGGCKAQSDEAVALVNLSKQLEEHILRYLDALRDTGGIDQRWLQTGRTDIEKGFMSVNRAVLQPGRVRLPSDDQE